MTQPPIANPPPIALQYQAAHVPACPPDWTNIQILGLRSEGLQPFLHLLLAVRLTIRFIMACLCLALAAWYYHLHHTPLSLLLFPAAVLLASLLFAAFRIVRRTRRDWASFRLTVSDQGLQRTLPGYPDLLILNHEIKSITETSTGLVVRTNRRLRALPINAAIENFPQLKERLNRVHPIRPDRWIVLRTARAVILRLALSAAMILAYFAGLFTDSLRLAALCLVAVTLIVIYTLTTALRSPNLTLAQKLFQFITLLLPLTLAARLLLEFLHKK